MEHELTCQTCGATNPPGGYPRGCPDCRAEGRTGRLEVTYDPGDIPESRLPGRDSVDAISNMWHYRSLLPLLPDEPVTLHEGGTPVIESRGEITPSGVTVLMKNETVNPTWSYKDRLNSLLISNALALGEDRIAVSSTGNHGASSAAYASRAGIEDVIVLVPDETDAPLRAQLRAYGADVIVTEYEGRGGLLAALVDRGWYPTVNVTPEYTGLPYATEAYKTIAFELVDQLPTVPDAVLTAIGAGDGLYGIWKGFRELESLGAIDRTPRMIGVQPAERASVVAALEAGAETVGSVTGPMPITTSVSGRTAGAHALRAIRESRGDALAIQRPEMAEALRGVARDGLLLEPASALAPAAIEPAYESSLIEPGETVVCIATGAGIKWPDQLEAIVGSAPRIEPTMDALAAAVERPLDPGS